MYPHRIRLHGPWQFEPLSGTVLLEDGTIEPQAGAVPPAGRIKIPNLTVDSPLHGFRGRVRWHRHFHAPRTLEPHERLWLSFDGVDYFAQVSLNGTTLGRHQGYFDPFGFDVTSLIRDRNDLVVEVDCPAEQDPANPRMVRAGLESHTPEFAAGLWRDVALQVRSIAFLSDVSLGTTLRGTTGHVRVQGRVHGNAETAVELDLTVHGSCVARQKMHAIPQGAEFAIDATVDAVEPWWPAPLGTPARYRVQLELHGAARTLDCFECSAGFRNINVDPSSRQAEINGRVVPIEVEAISGGGDPLLTDPASYSHRFAAASNAGCVGVHRIAGRVVAPALYDWADEQGRLLVQDFPWHAGQVGTDEQGSAAGAEAGREIVRQARAMVRLLGHHPSIAWWNCSSNPLAGSHLLARSVQCAINEADPSRMCCMPGI